MTRFANFSLAVALITLIVPTVRADEATGPVLSAVPDDAWAVLAVRNMADLDKKLGALGQQLNLPPISPLGMLKGNMGLVAGVNDDASMAMALMPLPAMIPDEFTKNLVLFVPTTDVTELVKTMEPEDAGDGLTKVMFAYQPSYVARKGDFAVISTNKDLVKRVADSKGRYGAKMSPHQLKRFAEDDVSLIASMDAAASSDVFKPFIGMMAQGGMDPATVTDMRSLQVGLRVDSKGVRLGWFSDAKPGSKLAEVMAAQTATDKSLLTGLPKEKYALALGLVLSKEASAEASKMLETALSGVFARAGPDGEAFAKLLQPAMSMLRHTRSASVCVSALPEGPNGLLGLTKVVTFEGGVSACMAELRKMVDTINDVLASGDREPKMTGLLELRPAAEQVDGQDVTHLLINVDKVPDLDDSAKASITSVFGAEGLLFRLAPGGGDRVVVTFGGGPTRLKEVMALAEEGKSPLDEDAGIVKARHSLPKERSMEAFIAVENVVALIKSIGNATASPPLPITMPEINAPIAVASAPIAKTGSQSEFYLPIETITAIKDAAMGLFMGGMGGPPGEPPPPPPPS